MGIREIEIFRAVMSSGSMSKAASLLGITQPAVSQAIRKLEATAGLLLFQRTRGRLVPTRECLALMSDVDRFFTGYELVEYRIRNLRSFGLGRLAVASNPAFGQGFMARVVAAFEATNQSVRVSLQVMNSHEVHRVVNAGQVDFGLLAAGISMAGLEHSTFAQLRAVAVMHEQHPLASNGLITARDLGEHAFIALNSGDPTRMALEAQINGHGVALNPVVETPNSHTVCEMALAKVGVGIAHPLVASDFVSRGLVIRPLALDVILSSVVAFRAGAPLSEDAKRFMRHMRVQLAREVSALSGQLDRAEPALAQKPVPRRVNR
ncbi:LysR substrate-binding domain-containing protein [Cupriavidus sp. 2KB_3]|uniref:LysR substrate-binding domain-containing protein n=1 Tax=Cupriavidus sp. 2KB_3 TaxID=3232980 RepID=UPI003F9164B9